MGSMFRSEEMCLTQLFLQSDAAYSCISELGELGLVQFRDLNADVSAFQRKYVPELRRCDEMERKLRYLEGELTKADIPSMDNNEDPEAPPIKEQIPLENQLETLESQLREVNANYEQLKSNFLELTQLRHVLNKTQVWFDEAQNFAENAPGVERDPETGEAERIRLLNSVAADEMADSPVKVTFFAGAMARERIPLFERILWRSCRGNVLLHHGEIEEPLEDPLTGEKLQKNVFLVIYQGEQLRNRVKKICESLKATIYPCPEKAADRRDTGYEVLTRIQDLEQVLTQTKDQRNRFLNSVARNVRVWYIKVRKMAAIYHTLNMFSVDLGQKCLIGEAWCPVSEIDRIQLALRRGTERAGGSVNSILQRIRTTMTPPTYFRTNKFTGGFQTLIDAYGIATYREVNPALFTIISFPFLFGVMFGDMGHGTIMALIAGYMIWKERQMLADKKMNEMVKMLFGGRYIVFLMGIFSIYTGFIYNDIFSKSINVFGSKWTVSNQPGIEDWLKNAAETDTIALNPNYTKTNVYPYGMDPMWQLATNKIMFIDSFKMKSSVILGVVQMCFGLVLSFLNHKYFGDEVSLIWEWIPQVLFMSCIFVYLCLTILIKWLTWDSTISGDAPSLLINLIGMFMMKVPSKREKTWIYGTVTDDEDGIATFQNVVQKILILVALACLPVMLFAKPYIKYKKHKERQNRGTTNFGGVRVNTGGDDTANILEDDDLAYDSDQPGAGEPPVEAFNVTEAAVEQMIHTIEYALGCISHTASYLRLWALSLAHAELSDVLWNMVLKIGLTAGGSSGPSALGAIMGFATFWAFATLSVAILIAMEGLSAFLHALRLHWVEFNSKFYHGEGIEFEPFTFKPILEAGDGNAE